MRYSVCYRLIYPWQRAAAHQIRVLDHPAHATHLREVATTFIVPEAHILLSQIFSIATKALSLPDLRLAFPSLGILVKFSFASIDALVQMKHETVDVSGCFAYFSWRHLSP